VFDYSSNRITHRVRLHFRSIAGTHVPFHNILANTQAVYANYGIKIEMVSGHSVKLTREEANKYVQVDGACKWRVEGTELQELQLKLGTSFTPNEITVIYVERFQELELAGCGGPSEPGSHSTSTGTSSCWDRPRARA
jgi:hypothetical protein